MYCKVLTASRSAGIGNGLTYETDDSLLAPGSPVLVPLRAKLVEGIVFEVMKERAAEDYDFKRVQEILGMEPLLSEAAIKTVRWVSENYLCSLRQAVTAWLPPAPWSSVLPKEVVGYRLEKPDFVDVKGKKQKAVMDYLMGKEWAAKDQIIRDSGVSDAVLSSLRKKGILSLQRRHEEMVPHSPTLPDLKALPILTPAQEAVYESIKKDPRPSLLFGVTGSGKTEIYAKLIADAVMKGTQAILLLPEILLTENFIGRFASLVDRSRIALIHSRLTVSQRRKEWKKVHRGEASLVIGSRSALFAPCKKLSLVIIDEEHEWTYKNEQSPRYHARETAEVLCKNAGAQLVLGTATPSLETWSRTKNGRYHLVRLPHRFNDQPLPTVKIVDLAQVDFGTLYPFSPPLLAAIRERLQKKEQTILFLNRRGVASALLCLQCRRRIVCPDSQLPFTLHHTSFGRPYLLDHTTGTMADVPSLCPHCQSTKLHPVGAGTQRIELLLQKVFPEARVLRADSDTMQHPEEIRSLLKAMKEGDADILLGTQSVVKGLDLPQVTLAAVLIADVGLSLPHFRAGERIFQLLTQLTGRSGRAKPGEVIIQTFRPDAPEIVSASKHETELYLEQELKMRLFAGYPPATKMVRILFRNEEPEKRARKVYADALKNIMSHYHDLKATVAPTFFGAGKEWQILLRGADPVALVKELDVEGGSVDVDPVETI